MAAAPVPEVAQETGASERPAEELHESGTRETVASRVRAGGLVQRDGADAPPPDDPTQTGSADGAVPLQGGAGASSTTITVQPVTRVVSAATLTSLWTTMTNSGAREAASVLPKFTPDPHYEYDDNDKVKKVVVKVVETKEMPEWAEANAQCPPIKNEWTRFYGVLDAHENRHVAIDKKHFDNIHLQLVGKKKDVAWQTVDDAIAAADAENQAYDSQSQHGIKEGANINTAVQCAPEKVGAAAGPPSSAGEMPAESETNPPDAHVDEPPPQVQAKLDVSEPDDPLEREADATAEQVMQMPAAPVEERSAGKCHAPGKCECAKCQRQADPGHRFGGVQVQAAPLSVARCAACEAEEEKWKQQPASSRGDRVHRKCAACQARQHASLDGSAAVDTIARSPGQPLDDETRAFMEPRFGFDFGHVRVHADAGAGEAARSISARAFTFGSDLAFAPGFYAPRTSQGRRLLAHELAHVVQQSGGGTPRSAQPSVQRQPVPAPAPAPPAANTPAPAEEVPAGYLVEHRVSRLRFTADQADIKRTLEQFVDERDSSRALELFEDESEYQQPKLFGTPILTCDLKGTLCETHRRRVTQLVKQEVKTLKSRMLDYREYFQRRGNDALNLLLADSEAKINAEKARYGLTKEEGLFSWLTGANYGMNNTEGLTAAAKRLLGLYMTVKAASDELKKCTELGGTLPPGGVDAMCTAEDQKQKEANLTEKNREYTLARREEEGNFQILLTYNLDPARETTHGTLATLAADSGSAKAEMLYEDIDKKLKNIKTTRDHAAGHKDVIWKLPAVIGATKNLPDVAGYSTLQGDGLRNIAIDDAQTAVTLGEVIQGAAIAAVAIGLGLLVAPLSAAGLAAAATAATATDVGIGVAMMLKAMHQYDVDQAATNTDLDAKAKSISSEEPSLFWLAVDIIMTVVQVGQAANQFRNIVRLSRAAKAAKVANQEKAATELLGDLKKAGEDVKPGVGERLVKEAEEASSAIAQDAGEIAANLEKAQPSAMAGYTHEIPLDGGKVWRRQAGGQWCLFASPPRCPLGVMDYILSPHLAGLSEETSAMLLNYKHIRKLALADPRIGVLLEKHGPDAVKALEHMRLSGENGLAILQKYDALTGRVEGAQQLLRDLAAGSSTTRGAVGEISYCEMLIQNGYYVERVGDWINGKKAADIILHNGTIIDMKYYDWTSWVWKSQSKVDQAVEKMAAQVTLRKTQYPGRAIVYVFAGDQNAIPPLLRSSLEKAGVTVVGTY